MSRICTVFYSIKRLRDLVLARLNFRGSAMINWMDVEHAGIAWKGGGGFIGLRVTE